MMRHQSLSSIKCLRFITSRTFLFESPALESSSFFLAYLYYYYFFSCLIIYEEIINNQTVRQPVSFNAQTLCIYFAALFYLRFRVFRRQEKMKVYQYTHFTQSIFIYFFSEPDDNKYCGTFVISLLFLFSIANYSKFYILIQIFFTVYVRITSIIYTQ